MAATAMEVGIVQGETVFKTWIASVLERASAHLGVAGQRTLVSCEHDGVRLSPESERWLSPSGHVPLRPHPEPTEATCTNPATGRAAPRAAAVDPALIDSRRLDEFRAIDDCSRSLTRELMGLFLTEAALAVRDIDLALAGANCCELARAGHALKALAGNVGAVGVVTICSQLEAHATRGRLSEAREQVWRLHLVWGQTRSVVEPWC
ncbi:Hpt domain-containing protein [Rhodoferax sp.]|uniref:Hpt domain-containing protein n=1 Tax=Rhodoferax sp. TaxID=50421 RepID=UPI0027788F94|nr:Hpt domain-containing protein [Rhodoferax sp.]